MELGEALERVRDGCRDTGGIGTLQEKTLHATLKLWLDEDTAHHEILLPEGCVADIFDGERVTEIQTGSLCALRPKLEAILDAHPVTVVHPVARQKRLCWIDPVTGDVTPGRLSPRKGTFTAAAAELVFLLPLLTHPNLTVRFVLLDMEELRLADGKRGGGKRGSHRVERYPTALGDTLTLRGYEDYPRLIPPELPEAFDSAAFAKAGKVSGRRVSAALKVLLTSGALTRERDGRRYLYHRANTPESQNKE